MTDAYIFSWRQSGFGRLNGLDTENIIAAAAREAINHPGLRADEIDAIFRDNFNNGFVPDVAALSLALHADDQQRFNPALRLKNACASNSAAIYVACKLIADSCARARRWAVCSNWVARRWTATAPSLKLRGRDS